MIHQEFLEQPREEILERIWCRAEEGADDVAGLVRECREPDVETVLEELAAEEMLRIEGGRVRLLSRGEERAKQVVRRHRLAERLLSDVFEVADSDSEQTACLMEHILSPAVTDAVCTFLGHPPTCPHGHPIPQGACCTARLRDLKPVVEPLTELRPGTEARIVFMSGGQSRRLDRLGTYGVVPGTVLRLAQKQPSVVVEIEGTTLALDRDVAKEIFVRRES